MLKISNIKSKMNSHKTLKSNKDNKKNFYCVPMCHGTSRSTKSKDRLGLLAH